MDRRKLTAATALIATIGGGSAVAVDNQIDPYTDAESRYEVTVAGERVRIAKDRPEVTLERWGGEEALTVKKSGTFTEGKRGWFSRQMVWEGEQSVIVEPLTRQTRGTVAEAQEATSTEEGFKIDILLEEKPDTNVFTLELKGYEDLDFFYQPELTPEEIAEGAERPENVVGSYAVYHKWKANHEVGGPNYQTGKLFHIYRPLVLDAAGNEVWGQLHYATGTLSVTVPQEFLDSATYPVRVDPTFGYTSVGGTQNTTLLDDFIQGNRPYTLIEDGVLESVSAYIGGAVSEIIMGVVTDADPGEVVAYGVGSVASTDAWRSVSLSSEPIVSGDYILFVYVEEDTNFDWYWDTVSGVHTVGDGRTYDGGMTDPIEWAVYPGSNNRAHSIYATYIVADPAIEYIDSTSASAGSGTAIACDAPTGMAADDVVVAVVHSNSNQSIADNNGADAFTQEGSTQSYNGGSGGISVWYRVADGSEPGSYAFTAGGSDRWAITCGAYRGVDTSDIWDVTPVSFQSGAAPIAPAIETTVDGAKILAIGAVDTNAVTFTSYPAGFQLRESEDDQLLSFLDDDAPGTAPVSIATSTWTTSAGAVGIGYHAALKPGTGGGDDDDDITPAQSEYFFN